jgi:hypothetical protein
MFDKRKLIALLLATYLVMTTEVFKVDRNSRKHRIFFAYKNVCLDSHPVRLRYRRQNYVSCTSEIDIDRIILVNAHTCFEDTVVSANINGVK